MKAKSICLLSMLSMMASVSLAQESEARPVKDRAQWNEYSRWTVGVNVGLPMMVGRSFSSIPDNPRRMNLGWSGGLQGTYQITPVFGVTLSADYNYLKLSARSQTCKLQEDAFLTRKGKGEYIKNLLVKNEYYVFGLGFDVNLVNLFAPNRVKPTRFAFVLTPTVFLQTFSPKMVYLNDTDKEYVYNKPSSGLSIGFGGAAKLIYRASKLVDIQLKGYMCSYSKNAGEGVERSKEILDLKGKYLADISAGVIFKLGNKNKKENLMWCPQNAIMVEEAKALTDTIYVHDTIKIETKTQVISVPDFPSIGYVMNSNKVDEKQYGKELDKIVTILKEIPEVTFDIESYTDKCGSVNFNKKISTKRAENLKAYLISKGISEERIINVKGMGADPASVKKFDKAIRRTVIVPHEKEITKIIQ